MAQTLEHNNAVETVTAVALPTFDGDVSNIQKLDDEPNDVGGMTAAQLKAEFDKGNEDIVKYINETLVPAVLAQDSTEEARQLAEGERVANEIERVSNENSRSAAESSRTAAEIGRISAEAARANAETDRMIAEGIRINNESARIYEEDRRRSAEDRRVSRERARESAETGYIAQARDAAEDSEAWAVGQRGGADVPTTDETYHNNAKYWAEQAEHAAGGGVTSVNGMSGVVTLTQDNVPAGSTYSRVTPAQVQQIADNATAIGLHAITIFDNVVAISGIKDGASINSFAGVETALADKAATVTVPASMDIIAGVMTFRNASGAALFTGKLPIYDPLLITALRFSSESPFTLTLGGYQVKQWDGLMEYSADGKTWAEYDGTEPISSGAENRLYLRGTGNTVVSSPDGFFFLTGTNVRCDGNIEMLLDYATASTGTHPPMGASCFSSLFFTNRNLISAPRLPSLELSEYCYNSMFAFCPIEEAPELPATTLAEGCYYGMFAHCSALRTAPSLPAVTLADECYASMFEDCTSLTDAPSIAATSVGIDSCFSMFAGAAISNIPRLAATTLAEECYGSMFSGCENIKLSATQTEKYPYPYRIPAEGTGTTAEYALDDMFANTGGTFTGTPEINTTYYTDHEPTD